MPQAQFSRWKHKHSRIAAHWGCQLQKICCLQPFIFLPASCCWTENRPLFCGKSDLQNESIGNRWIWRWNVSDILLWSETTNSRAHLIQQHKWDEDIKCLIACTWNTFIQGAAGASDPLLYWPLLVYPRGYFTLLSTASLYHLILSINNNTSVNFYVEFYFP